MLVEGEAVIGEMTAGFYGTSVFIAFQLLVIKHQMLKQTHDPLRPTATPAQNKLMWVCLLRMST